MGRWELISKGLILEIYFFCKGDGPITGGRGGGAFIGGGLIIRDLR